MSGENVTITVKHKHSFDVPWLSHLSCAGNSFWGTESNNGQGQLDRRVLLFQFRQLEQSRKDPTIKARIEADMLPIIIKGIRAYKSLIAAAKAHTATVRGMLCWAPAALHHRGSLWVVYAHDERDTWQVLSATRCRLTS